MLSTFSSRASRSASSQEIAIRELVDRRVGDQWCLFLDRDGVINRQIVGDYVRTWRDFELLPDVVGALKILRDWAPYIVVVTNQQGIGKGLMSVSDVDEVHRRLQDTLALNAVKVDAFQVCPHLESAGCQCRKPRTGMVLSWLAKHRVVNASLSVIVGDSVSDTQLAHNVAAVVGSCAAVRIGARSQSDVPVDASFNSLWDFAVAVREAKRGKHS